MKIENVKSYKAVELPHIRTTVYFMDMSQLKGVPIEGSAYTVEMDYDQRKINIAVFIEDIENSVKDMKWMPIIAHELMHVMQIICERIGAQIEEEKEHTAHMTSHLFAELIGLSIEE